MVRIVVLCTKCELYKVLLCVLAQYECTFSMMHGAHACAVHLTPQELWVRWCDSRGQCCNHSAMHSVDVRWLKYSATSSHTDK